MKNTSFRFRTFTKTQIITEKFSFAIHSRKCERTEREHLRLQTTKGETKMLSSCLTAVEGNLEAETKSRLLQKRKEKLLEHRAVQVLVIPGRSILLQATKKEKSISCCHLASEVRVFVLLRQARSTYPSILVGPSRTRASMISPFHGGITNNENNYCIGYTQADAAKSVGFVSDTDHSRLPTPMEMNGASKPGQPLFSFLRSFFTQNYSGFLMLVST